MRSESELVTVRRMGEILKHRGRLITESEVAFIGQLIAEHPAASRRALSQKLCQA